MCSLTLQTMLAVATLLLANQGSSDIHMLTVACLSVCLLRIVEFGVFAQNLVKKCLSWPFIEEKVWIVPFI